MAKNKAKVKGLLLCLEAFTESYTHSSEITAKSCTTYKKCRQLGQKFDSVTKGIEEEMEKFNAEVLKLLLPLFSCEISNDKLGVFFLLYTFYF